MRILLSILLLIGSTIVIALLIAAVFGIKLIDQVFEYFDGDDTDED